MTTPERRLEEDKLIGFVRMIDDDGPCASFTQFRGTDDIFRLDWLPSAREARLTVDQGGRVAKVDIDGLTAADCEALAAELLRVAKGLRRDFRSSP